MPNCTRGAALFVLTVTSVACAVMPPAQGGPPALVIGSFMDDYNSRHVITATEWRHGGAARYHVVKWSEAGRYLIARNDSANPSEAGRWTRIDWMPLSGMPPYEWAFCLTAYDAASAEAAERTAGADRAAPRTGCNGFPFSRMKRATP